MNRETIGAGNNIVKYIVEDKTQKMFWKTVNRKRKKKEEVEIRTSRRWSG